MEWTSKERLSRIAKRGAKRFALGTLALGITALAITSARGEETSGDAIDRTTGNALGHTTGNAMRDDSPRAAAEREHARDERERMVETQLVARGIADPRVLAAMRKVPRHEFVDPRERSGAYQDGPLPIGEGQTISQPYIVAIMTELAHLDATSRVLEVGTGSGYQAAVLAEVAGEVYSIEIVPELAERASVRLAHLGYEGVHLRQGDGYAGWPEAAPFDAIVVTAAPPQVPQPLLDQLAQGGRLVVPVGQWIQELMVYTKRESGIERESIIPVRFVPMTGEIQKRD